MDIQEELKIVNEKLVEGQSITRIEKELGYGKDTLRKKLNRAGYVLNKDLKQFVLDDNIVCYKDTEQGTGEVITHNNIDSYKKNTKAPKPPQPLFNEEDMEILRAIINQYKATQKVQEIALDGEIITRSVRVYKEPYNQFAQFCKDNNINQAEALARAVIDFMNGFK